ncbi:hypothetical protein FOA52_005267 [Chlamydomonas sp. UWO 241]|nr:hypothetical protein FOA52_005267 [Chlamydomonas sp. UWO 241]
MCCPHACIAAHDSHRTRAFSSSATRAPPKTRASAGELGLYWGAAAIGMVGVSFATVPLYKIFCAATGYGGTPAGLDTVEEKLARRRAQPNEKVETAAAQREVTIWFNGDVADNMPWEFVPTQEFVRVKPGQSTLVFFTARNKSDQPVTGYSVFNVTPDKSAVYFNKIQCFCFEMQRLRANEEIDMPVFFYVDPEFATDWNCRNVDNITLSYMFHRVDDEDLDEEDLHPDAPTLIKLHAGTHAGTAPGGAGGAPAMGQQAHAAVAAPPA